MPPLHRTLWAGLKRQLFQVAAAGVYVRSRLRKKRLVIYYLDLIFARKCQALALLLNQHGIRAEIMSGLSRATRLQLRGSADVWIGFWNSVPLHDMPTNYILWNAEPLSMKRWSNGANWAVADKPTECARWHFRAERREAWLEIAMRAKAFWGYSKQDEPTAQNMHKPFSYVPFGYSPFYETAYQDSVGNTEWEQDIDVLFFGWISERRQRMLDSLTARGIRVFIATEHNAAIGPDLDRLLARSKMVLGIFGYDDPDAHVPDLARFDYLLSNRIFALHERPSDTGRDEDFEKHVPMSDYAHMPDDCLYYLDHPEVRYELSQRAYDWFKTAYALDAFVPVASLSVMLK